MAERIPRPPTSAAPARADAPPSMAAATPSRPPAASTPPAGSSPGDGRGLRDHALEARAGAIGEALDKKIAGIREQLDEAAKLRAEAEALRDEYEAKAAAADAESARPCSSAPAHEADEIVEKAKADTAALIERRTRMAEDKIAAAERAAIDEVRARPPRRSPPPPTPYPRRLERRCRQGDGRRDHRRIWARKRLELPRHAGGRGTHGLPPSAADAPTPYPYCRPRGRVPRPLRAAPGVLVPAAVSHAPGAARLELTCWLAPSIAALPC